jgi:hypothetical protein
MHLGILIYADDESDELNVERAGLVHSYLLSVGNDTRWVKPLEDSTSSCYEKHSGKHEGFMCEGLRFSIKLNEDY